MEKNIEVKCFIPEDLKDRIISVNGKSILSVQGTWLLRYYGIYLDEVQIGEAMYSLLSDSSIFELDKIDIESKYQRSGYGSILLNESIKEILNDYPYLDRLNVCSFPWSIEFYLKNGFVSYLGENNLTKYFGRANKKDGDVMSEIGTEINGERITTQWYQYNALRTLNDFKDRDTLKLNAYTGIIGEYGEFFDYIKKLYTHNLTLEKQEEVCNLAPKELGDVVWYLVTSLAVYYDYSFDEVYECITGVKQEDGYDIDIINHYIGQEFQKDNMFSEMMKFKLVLNKLDLAQNREEVIKVVAEIMVQIARILKGLFGRNLSDVLYANIDKLRKRYPEGFSSEVSNVRIDAQKKYKEEESMKVLKKENGEYNG